VRDLEQWANCVDGPGGYVRQLCVLAQMTKLRVLEQRAESAGTGTVG